MKTLEYKTNQKCCYFSHDKKHDGTQVLQLEPGFCYSKSLQVFVKYIILYYTYISLSMLVSLSTLVLNSKD